MSKKSGAKVVRIDKGAKREDSGPRWRNAAHRADSWFNTLTGIGVVGQDRIQSGDFNRRARLGDQFLENLYNGDDLASRIVDAVPEEALREGYEITIEPDEETDESAGVAKEMASDVEKDLEGRLFTTERFVEGWAWGRLFGGGPIYMVINDGVEEQALPVRENTIQSIDALTIIDKRDLIVHTYYRDPEDPKFGEVRTYRVHHSGPLGASGSVQLQGIEIHETRLLIFRGVRTTMRERWIGEGWDFSVLQRVFDVLRQFNLSWSGLANMLQTASQGIFSIDGLIDMISSEDTDTLQTRMGLVDAQRSNVRSLLIDADKEKYDIASVNFAGIPDSMRMFLLRLAAAAKMPLTVLFGMSPAGLNATGESDLRIWSGVIKSEQTHSLKPHLMRLARLDMLAKQGPTSGALPERWDIVFPPLVKLSEAEQVAVRKTMAEADGIYIDRGVLFPEEVAINRFPMGGFSLMTSIDTSDRQAMLEAEAVAVPDDETLLLEPPPDDEGSSHLEENTEHVDPQTALTGGQIKALQDIIDSVRKGNLKKTTAIQIIATSFPVSAEDAAAILADVEAEPPKPMPPGAAPPFTSGGSSHLPEEQGSGHLEEDKDKDRDDSRHPIDDDEECAEGPAGDECRERKRRARGDEVFMIVEIRTDRVVKNGPPDKPYCVVAKSTGERIACHATREAALRQLAAIEAQGGRTDQAAGLHVHAIPIELQEQLGGAFTSADAGLRHRHKTPNGGITGDATASAAHTHSLPFRGETGRPVDPPAE